MGLEKSIFVSALDRGSGSERDAFLARACGSDAGLRQVVNELLSAHERSVNVLDKPLDPMLNLRGQIADAEVAANSAGGQETAAWGGHDNSERTGEVIGNFRLMEKIGEGGFGQVYVADQQHPVRRRVALKLLKRGMDSREVIARFEAERQALAIMEHPNIARVFDAGTTAAGQPYFVMELVRGVPITDFCDQQRLSVEQRLELFIDMCQAVQHAHQKGVIHRDLKPSNVMVTLHDATCVVKVIDFGVAKAISEPLTEKTLYTRFAQMIGTPLYMSPEQAEMNGLDIDTRSDIYALGVLLYELLTGTTPFDGRRLITATFDELRRIIREEEPPRPSVRLSNLLEATNVAQLRGDLRALRSALRGDLDWVVMKALEKDRERRYATATDLARDVRRYLDQQPVLARPPTRLYRFSKFARRYKVALTTVSLVLLSLCLGMVVSIWQAVQATRARAEADTLRTEAVEFASRLKESNVLLDSARANADQRRWEVALEQSTRATELQPEHYLTWSGRGALLVRLGAWKTAAADFSKALNLGAPANNPGWWGVPQLCLYAGEVKAYELACAHLGEQVQRSSDPAFVSLSARSLALRPLPIDEARDLAALVEEIIAKGRAQDFARPPFGPGAGFGVPLPPLPPELFNAMNFGNGPATAGNPFVVLTELQAYAAGIVHFRSGALELAKERLELAVYSKSELPTLQIGLPVLAMVLHDLGKPEEAAMMLAKSEHVLQRWTTAISVGGVEQLPLPWFDYLESLTMYREAHRKLCGIDVADDVRLDQVERSALAMLHAKATTDAKP